MSRRRSSFSFASNEKKVLKKTLLVLLQIKLNPGKLISLSYGTMFFDDILLFR